MKLCLLTLCCCLYERPWWSREKWLLMGSLSLPHCAGLCWVQVFRKQLGEEVEGSILSHHPPPWTVTVWLTDGLFSSSVKMFPVNHCLNHSWLFILSSKMGVYCVGDIDTRKTVVSGVKEWQKEVRNAKQGMQGNQQVSSCVCVWIPPFSKNGLWVIGGQVCTGNQMFSSAQLPVTSLHK